MEEYLRLVTCLSGRRWADGHKGSIAVWLLPWLRFSVDWYSKYLATSRQAFLCIHIDVAPLVPRLLVTVALTSMQFGCCSEGIYTDEFSWLSWVLKLICTCNGFCMAAVLADHSQYEKHQCSLRICAACIVLLAAFGELVSHPECSPAMQIQLYDEEWCLLWPWPINYHVTSMSTTSFKFPSVVEFP